MSPVFKGWSLRDQHVISKVRGELRRISEDRQIQEMSLKGEREKSKTTNCMLIFVLS